MVTQSPEQPGSAPSCFTAFAKAVPSICNAVPAPPSPVQPTHTSLPKRPASAPPGLEAPKSRNQGSALQPQGPRGLSTESAGSVGGAELLTQRGAPGSGRRAWPRQWRHSGKWEAMSLRV